MSAVNDDVTGICDVDMDVMFGAEVVVGETDNVCVGTVDVSDVTDPPGTTASVILTKADEALSSDDVAVSSTLTTVVTSTSSRFTVVIPPDVDVDAPVDWLTWTGVTLMVV